MEEGGNYNLQSVETATIRQSPEGDTDHAVNELKVEHNEIQNSKKATNISDSQTVESATKDPQNPEEKLNDWLIHRARGIGNFKFTKRRWFKFSEENCKLYMYR